MSKFSSNAIFGFCALLACVSQGFGQINPSVVIAKSGDDAPGLSGVRFATQSPVGFYSPRVNSTGSVAFFGFLSGTGVTANVNDQSLWMSSTSGSSAHQLVARNGDAAVGIAGANFSSIDTTGAISDTGLVAFQATVSGGGTTSANNVGQWSWSSGSGLSLVARSGDTAVGTGDGTWNTFTTGPLVLPDGRIAFGATLNQQGSVNSTNDSGYWIGTPGNMQLLIRKGDAVQGLTGVTYSAPLVLGMNATGQFTLRSTLAGTGVTTANGNVMATGTAAGNFTILMRAGDTPTGIPAGQTVSSVGGSSAVLANGQSYFSATLTGTGVTTANETTVWVGSSPSTLQLVFRAGDQVPGLPTGVVFSNAGIPRAYGNTVVYKASLAGTGVTTSNDYYIGRWSSGTGIQVVAREGDIAPGTTDATYGNLNSLGLGDGLLPVIGSDGSIAFRSTLLGANVTTGLNDAGIFLFRNGTVQLLARRGDVIDLGPGQGSGTIADLTFAVSQFGTTSGISDFTSDSGFSYLATLTDGRSVILFSPVPEPTTIITLIVAGMLMFSFYFFRA